MNVVISIPDELVEPLREAIGPELERSIKEAIALESYRRGKLCRDQVQSLLGFIDRHKTKSWLREHGLKQSISSIDLEEDRRAMESMAELTALSQEMGLYDPPYDNPLVKKQ